MVEFVATKWPYPSDALVFYTVPEPHSPPKPWASLNRSLSVASQPIFLAGSAQPLSVSWTSRTSSCGWACSHCVHRQTTPHTHPTPSSCRALMTLDFAGGGGLGTSPQDAEMSGSGQVTSLRLQSWGPGVALGTDVRVL